MLCTLTAELRTRLLAAKEKMQSMPDSSKASFSEIQAAAISESARGLTTAALSARVASDLMETAAEVGFTETDLSLVVESLKAATTKQKKEKKERKQRQQMQDFSNVFGFFTDAEWDCMQKAENVSEVREVLFSRIVALGARCPKEETKRLLTACQLLLTEDMRCPISLGKKIKTHEALKKAWVSYVRRLQDPDEYIVVLPPSPQQYSQRYPALMAKAYPNGEVPVKCRIDFEKIEFLATTFNSRGNMPTLHKQEEIPTINLPGGALHQQVQAFGSSLAAELQRQGERQDRMLEVLLQDRTGNSLDNKRLRCDSELFGRHLHMRGERNLAIMDGPFKRLRSSSSSQLAITAGGEDEDIPRRSAAPQALPPPPAAAPAAPEAAPAAAAPAAAPAAPPTAIDLLDMLETRDAHKKLQAKIAKAKAKVDEERLAAKEGGQAKDVDSTPKKDEQPKAKGKAKAKSKAKGVEAKSGDPKAN